MASFNKGLQIASGGSKYHIDTKPKKIHPHVKSGSINIKASQNVVINQSKLDSVRKVMPSTALASNAINNGTHTDYKIPNTHDTLNDLWFNYTISNDSSTAGTEQQQTIDFEQEASVIADGGSVFFEYGGEQSDEVAWNATEATLAASCLTALNAMTSVTNAGGIATLAVTSGDWATTKTDLLLTATWSETGVKDLIICNSSLEDGGILLSPPASTVTVAGVEGGLTTNAFACVRQFEFLGDGGQELFVVRSDDLYLENAFYGADELERHRRCQNLTAAFANDEKIALSGSKEFSVRVPNPFSESGFFLGSLSNDLTIRVQWANADWASTGTASDGSVSNAYFWCYGYSYDASQAMEMKSRLSSNVHYRGLKNYQQNFQQAFTSATAYDFTLNSLNNAEVSYLVVMLRLSTIKGANQIAPEEITSIELLDSDGVVVGIAQNDMQNRLMFDGSNFPGSLIPQKKVYSFVFGDPVEAKMGLSTGYYSLRGNERLRITTGTLASSGSTYTLSVNAYAPTIFGLDASGRLVQHC